MSTPVYAGFWRRFVAFSVDMILVQVTAGTLVTLALWLNGASSEDLSGEALQVLGGLGTAAVFIPYFSLCHFRWGRTPGQRFMRVRVVSAATQGGLGLGRAIGRSLAFFLTYGFFMIGLIMAGFDSKKRALHDRIAGTLCLKDGD